MGQRLDNATALYLEAIRDGNYVDAINAYTGTTYRQHSTPVKDGREGFIEFFADFTARNPIRDIEIIRGFEDGQYVFVHAVQTLNDGEFAYVTADIFDTDDDAKMIEHWDIIEELDGTTGSRRQVDGPTEPTDLEATEDNKALVARFVQEVLVAGQFGRLPEYVATGLAQHRPGIADGLDAFRAHAEAVGLRYVELHRVIGCGSFVATLAESELRGVRHAVIDLYRVAGGMIVEHWDVIEEITPRDTWVNSGKF